MRRLPILTLVLVLGALPQIAEGQGRGRPKNPQASSDSIASESGPVSTSQFKQFGVWLDDATTRGKAAAAPGSASATGAAAGPRSSTSPILDAAYAVTDRVQLGMSVPFYRSDYFGTTSRGVDDMYLSGKIVLIDPAIRDARFGIAVTPLLEVLSPGSFEDRVHWALPISAEFRATPLRVYGSTGYFSRGAVFGAGAVEWASPLGTSLTFALTHSTPTSEDTTGLTGGRSDFSVAVGHSLNEATSAYVGFGRTLSSPDDANKTSLAISGGVSFSFTARSNP